MVTNAGNRFVCNQGTIFSCSGNPIDDYLNGEFVDPGRRYLASTDESPRARFERGGLG